MLFERVVRVLDADPPGVVGGLFFGVFPSLETGIFAEALPGDWSC